MKKRQLILVSLAVGVIMMGGYVVGKRMVLRQAQPAKQPVGTQEALTRQPGDVIVKGKTEDMVNYKIYGAFTTTLQPEGKYLTAPFVVTGDPKKREIQVFVGMADGQVLWGEYEGSIQGSSTWKVAPTREIAGKVAPGEEVSIELSLPIGPKGASGEEVFLDQLKRELAGGGTGKLTEVPEYMGLAAGKIGGLP